jgi:hypothetical protein
VAQTRIFVSHSAKDNEWARRFAAALSAIGYDVWYDETGLRGGAAWVAGIQHEVETRDVFLLVLTPDAWKSRWVQGEVQLAIAARRRIMPVLVRNTHVSGFLLTTQWITAIGEDPPTAARAAVLEIEAPQRPTGALSHQRPLMRSIALGWAGYAAAAWAFLFAATSFYWALGGRIGVETIGDVITTPALAGDPTILAIVWITGALKVVTGVAALALVQPWGQRVPRWALLLAGCGASGLFLLYGAANLVQDALIVAGLIPTPAGLGMVAARWHLLLWDPWWLLGGSLFALATLAYGRRQRGR